MPGNLFRQSVVMQGRPVRNGGWIDEGHGYLKLVSGSDPWNGGRQRIEAPAQRDNPIVLAEVKE